MRLSATTVWERASFRKYEFTNQSSSYLSLTIEQAKRLTIGVCQIHHEHSEHQAQ